MHLYCSTSGGSFDHFWLNEPLPFNQYDGKKIHVICKHPGLRFEKTGHLLAGSRPEGGGYVTIQVPLPGGMTPPSHEPPSRFGWEVVPSSVRFDCLRIALDSEAIRSIRPVSSENCDYEIRIPPEAFLEMR